ncbi:alpha-amylase family glycosyl hydrolase [Fervidobacterium pennivorans subsp. carthaginiensis]|uniref:alpha-amylase family glycosyl hydrolase n=1 Tax=Fervidobacterium pennivorans TaxID=93466 RepID=UPI00355BD334
MHKVNKLSFYSFTVLILLLIFLGFSACSPLKTVSKGKIQISVNVNIPKSVETKDTKHKINAYIDEVSSVELVVYDSANVEVLRQSVNKNKDISFSFELPSGGTYKFVANGKREDNSLVFTGEKTQTLQPGQNYSIIIDTKFVNGYLTVFVDLDDELLVMYDVQELRALLRDSSGNVIKDESFQITPEATRLSLSIECYPRVYSVGILARLKDKATSEEWSSNSNEAAVSVEIKPGITTDLDGFKISFDPSSGHPQVIYKFGALPPTITGAIYNVDTNELTINWSYPSTTPDTKFYIYLLDKNNTLSLWDITTSYSSTQELLGVDFWNVQKIGVRAVVNGKESKIEYIDKSNINITSIDVPLTSSTMYTLFLRSFCDANGDGIGDFRGVSQKVDYLKSLGVDTVWFLPFTKANSYHGYDVEDYYDVEPDYGSFLDLENMIKELNQNGIRVVMDLVVNHTSDTHPWFLDAVENTTNSKYWNYYIMTLENREGEYYWHWKVNSKGEKVYYFGLFGFTMPDLNFDNPAVMEEIKKIIDFWIVVGVDGFRLDAPKHYKGWDLNDDIPGSAYYAQQIEDYIRSKLGSDAIVVGEVFDGNPSVLSQFAPMPAFNFTFMYGIAGERDADKITGNYEGKDNLLGETISWVNGATYYLNVKHFPFIDNHDLDRWISVLIDEYYAGNTQAGIRQYLLTNALLLSLDGMPVIYYGNEIGLRGWKWRDKDPWDLPVREPMQWYANQQGEGQTWWTKTIYEQKNITFGNANEDGAMYDDPDDGVSVEEQQQMDYSILNFFKQYISLRANYPALGKGSLTIERDWKNLYAIKRVYGTQEVLILINLDPIWPNNYTVPAGYRWVWYAFFNDELFEFGPKNESPLETDTDWTVNPRQVYVFVKN